MGGNWERAIFTVQARESGKPDAVSSSASGYSGGGRVFSMLIFSR